jgi:hypothetical protein
MSPSTSIPSSNLHTPTPRNMETQAEASCEDNSRFHPPSKLDNYPSISQSALVLQRTKSSTDLDEVFTSTWGTYDPNTVDDDEVWEPELVVWENSPASKDIETPVGKQQDITVARVLGVYLELLPTILEVDEPEGLTDIVDRQAGVEIRLDNSEEVEDWKSLCGDIDTDPTCEVASPRTGVGSSYHHNTLDVGLASSQSLPTVMSSNYLSSARRSDDLSYTKIPGLSTNKALYSTEEQNQGSSIPSSLSVAQTTSEVDGFDDSEGTDGDDDSEGTDGDDYSEGAEEDDTLPTQEAEDKPLLKRSQWIPNFDEIFEDFDVDFDVGLNEAWDQETVGTDGALVVSSGRQHASTTGPLVITSESLRLSTGSSVDESFGSSDFTQQYESGAALFVQYDAEATNTLPSDTEDSDTSTVPPPTDEELEAFNEEERAYFLNKFQNTVHSSRDQFGELTSAPNSGVHHFNYFGYPQYNRVDTNAAYSLRLILKGGTHLLQELSQKHAFRQGVIMRDIYANIDPVVFFGSRAQLEELKSVGPQEFFRAVRGRTYHIYNPFGNWQEDQFDEEDHRPVEDNMSLDDYHNIEEMGGTVLNGWYKATDSPSLLIPDFWKQTVRNTDPHHPAGFKTGNAKKKAIFEHGYKRSRLCEVTTITTADSKEEAVCESKSPISEDEDQVEDIWTSEDDESSRTSDEGYQYYADDEMDVSEEQPVNEEEMKDAGDEVIPALEEENKEPERPSALDSTPMTDEPAMEKVKPYWNKLRLQVPIQAVETAKPEKRSLRQSIKKVAWKVAPWALRPLYAS